MWRADFSRKQNFYIRVFQECEKYVMQALSELEKLFSPPITEHLVLIESNLSLLWHQFA